MNAPDIFALGGREGTRYTELMRAGARWAALQQRLDKPRPDDDRAKLAEEYLDVVDFIDAAEPSSLVECVVKLSTLSVQATPDMASVRQVIAFLEGIAGPA